MTPGHFDTLRIGLVAGRTFTSADAENSALVAVVDEEFARLHFPGGGAAGAIGERLMFPQTDER